MNNCSPKCNEHFVARLTINSQTELKGHLEDADGTRGLRESRGASVMEEETVQTPPFRSLPVAPQPAPFRWRMTKLSFRRPHNSQVELKGHLEDADGVLRRMEGREEGGLRESRGASVMEEEVQTVQTWDGNGPIRTFPSGFKAVTDQLQISYRSVTDQIQISCRSDTDQIRGILCFRAMYRAAM